MIERIKYQANANNANGMANKARKKRQLIVEKFFYETFKSKIEKGEKVKTLDIGGTYQYWKAMEFKYFNAMDITLANIIEMPALELGSDMNNIHAIKADAIDLNNIKDKEFDFVFSNSCIEHVGGMPEQQQMANEVKRVGSHYYLQTPNRFFPIEPHFLFPLFQFFPLQFKAFLICHFQMGFMQKGKTKREAREIGNEIKLLSYGDLKKLFPKASIKREKMFGLTKSFMLFE